MTRAANTKRDAALATQAQAARAALPTVVTDASGARIRTVAVHLTPFAPGIGTLALQHPRRWATLYGKSPLQAVRATCARIRQSPRDLVVDTAAQAAGDVALMGQVPPELARLVSDAAATRVPFAIFWDGITAAEVTDALAALVTAGWTPPAPLSTNP